MKVCLMHRDRDFDLDRQPPAETADLVQDLALERLFVAMSGGDEFVLLVARRGMLASLGDPAAVLYRQEILRDCLANPEIVRDLYRLAGEAIERERKHFWFSAHHPSSLLHRSVDVMGMFLALLRRLRTAADTHAGGFHSEGFTAWFSRLRAELSDEYLDAVEAHLARLRFRRGVLISGRLGKALLGTGHRLRRPHDNEPWLRRLVARRSPSYIFRIHERDEGGARRLGELKDRGIDAVADALAQANDHILAFFAALRTELAFYVGCLNLYEALRQRGAGVCLPVPAPPSQRRWRARGLYDPGLALALDRPVVANDLDGDGKDLVMITGANQGGKSTFLRGLGAAQLMLQCGMFVAAQSFDAGLCEGIFTHFKREEDPSMRHGKFEEEVQRVSAIVDRLTPGSMVLFNESFQSTNEREGSEIARQIVEALRESGVRMAFVTHLYELAASFANAQQQNAAFLRAERLADGRRTFRLVPGAPQSTSYGHDVFAAVFGDAALHRGTDVEVAGSGAPMAERAVAMQKES